MHMTVKNGVRWSAANAYLRPAMKRSNLVVRTKVMTRRILLENGRAIGVEYEKNGKIRKALARQEVIIATGPIGSPHLLQRSGIGPAAVLKKAGVEVLHDLPGVGENLQDHAEVYIQFACKKPITLNSKMDWISKGLIGLRWLLFKDGLGATNHFEAGGFIRSSAEKEWPDIQYHFLPAAVRYDGKKPIKGHGFMILTGPNKPKSRGYVRLKNADPFTHPDILFNYLDREEDRKGFRDCIRLSREVLAQPAMVDFNDGEILPGPDTQSDDALDAFVRDNLESTYHPCGTCKMGVDELAVVDPELRVHGLEGLRVVDSSVFPSEPNGNLNAPTMMLAERGADIILGKTLLPPENAPVGYAQGIGKRQRTGRPTVQI